MLTLQFNHNTALILRATQFGGFENPVVNSVNPFFPCVRKMFNY